MHVTRDEILEQLRYELNDIMVFIRNKNANKFIEEEAHLTEQIKLDSLDIMDFISRAELHYRIEVGADSFEKLYNIGLIADYMCDQLNNSSE